MYQYTFSEDTTSEIRDKAQRQKDLEEKFKAIDDKWDFAPPEEQLELEKKTFNKKSDEDIKKQAENDLYDYKQTGREGIENEYAEKLKSADENIDSVKVSGEQRKAETKNLISSLKDDASKDAIKRGLGRSSIVINILDAFDKDMIAQINKINDEITTKVEDLNTQKDLLNEKRQSALESFDLGYAVKLSERIDKINEELAEQEEKVLEYNNQIAQKEAEFEKKRREEKKEYFEFVEDDGLNRQRQKIWSEKMQAALEYLNTLPKAEALKELEENPTIKTNLDSMNYQKLKTLIDRRTD